MIRNDPVEIGSFGQTPESQKDPGRSPPISWGGSGLGRSGGRHSVWLPNRRRLDAESVGEAHKQAEQRGVVGGLCDLLVGPVRLSQLLHQLVGDFVGVSGNGRDEVEQESLRLSQLRGVEIPIAERLSRLDECLALQLQEPGV